MTALVTGGTGFVGGAIVRSLRARGRDVRVLARPTSETAHLDPLGVEIARGDVLDRDSVLRALDGCDTLYHAAAPFDFWLPDTGVLRTTTVGTRNVMEAALAAGVSRVVYTSAASTIGERRGEVGDERTVHRGYHVTPYERAEYQAEQIARSYLERGLPLVTVNPASVYGPGNFKPVGRAMINAVNGRIPAIFEGAVSYVYIDDAGEGHALAAERGVVGERYILSGPPVSMSAWMSLLCRLAGVRTPPRIPVVSARLYAEAGEALSRLTHKPPVLPRGLLLICAHGFRVSGLRAERELGLHYTPLEEGLRRTLAWYWEQGLLKRKPACVP
jgi:dihydroflavonol-4-reductase